MDVLEKLEILKKQMFVRGSWDSQLDTVKEAIVEIENLRQQLETTTQEAMKPYLYYELGTPEPIEITEDEIIILYWENWRERMIKKFGAESLHINRKNCIDDWVVVNWAWKKKE